MEPEFNPPMTRRSLLARSAMGVGGVALATLLQEEGLLAAPHVPRNDRTFDFKPKKTHFEPRAKAMISLFMHGGPSPVDLFEQIGRAHV